VVGGRRKREGEKTSLLKQTAFYGKTIMGKNAAEGKTRRNL